VAPLGFTVVVEHLDGAVLVCPVGELDLATAPVLEQVLETFVGGPPAIDLDLSGLTFVDRAGCGPSGGHCSEPLGRSPACGCPRPVPTCVGCSSGPGCAST
jgi:hypothetical protein